MFFANSRIKHSFITNRYHWLALANGHSVSAIYIWLHISLLFSTLLLVASRFFCNDVVGVSPLHPNTECLSLSLSLSLTDSGLYRSVTPRCNQDVCRKAITRGDEIRRCVKKSECMDTASR